MPNSFITHSFKQRISPQFLSVLNMELEGAMRDSDKNSHEEKFKKLLEANEFNPIPMQERIADQMEIFIKNNSLIHQPPVFLGLALT